MEDKAYIYLVKWIIGYLKNRDLVLKNIEKVEKNKDGFDVYVKFKDKEQFFIVKPLIENAEEVLSRFKEEGFFGLVVLNTESNFDILVRNWGKLVKFKHLCVYFVNPFSQLDKKWIVYPYVHNNICEGGALKKGLKAMFEMVEPLIESSIKDKF